MTRKFDEIAKIVKGAANAHRVRILFELKGSPRLTLYELADELKLNFRTVSEHTKKLVSSGLVSKKYNHTSVEHSLSPLGQKLLRLLQDL